MTRAQRHKIYKKLYIIIKKGTHYNCPWMCNILSTEFNLDIEKLRELIKHKPKINADGGDCRSYSAWFKEDDINSRLKVLRSCIRETAPKKKKK